MCYYLDCVLTKAPDDVVNLVKVRVSGKQRLTCQHLY